TPPRLEGDGRGLRRSRSEPLSGPRSLLRPPDNDPGDPDLRSQARPTASLRRGSSGRSREGYPVPSARTVGSPRPAAERLGMDQDQAGAGGPIYSPHGTPALSR